MAASMLKPFVLVLLAIGICKGDDCSEAQMKFASCAMSNQIDYERITDPSYQAELCALMNRLITCVDEIKEACPSFDMLNGEQGQNLDAMLNMVRNYCPENPPEECPNPTGDLLRCSQTMQDFSEDNICQKAREYLDCMEPVAEKCQGHPMLEASMVDNSLSAMRDIVNRPQCANTEVEGEGEGEGEDEGEGEGPSCSNPQAEFMICNELIEDFDKQSACQQAQDYVTCVDRLIVNCADHPMLSGSAGEQLDSALTTMRGMLSGPYCQNTPVTSIDDDDDEEVTTNEVVPKKKKKCTRKSKKFFEKLNKCYETLSFNINEDIMCTALTKVRRCVKKLLVSCMDRDFMTEEVVTDINNSIAKLKQSRVVYNCRAPSS